MTEDRPRYDSGAWESFVEAGKEEDRKRRRNFFKVFEAGGADKVEAQTHYNNVAHSLLQTGHYETAAVLLRGFGYTEESILAYFKSHHLWRGAPASHLWETIHASGIQPNPRAVVGALQEVSARRGEEEEDFDSTPF